jgi:hypothetical protein
MPEIMRQYGQTIVVAVAGVMIVALLFALWPSESGAEGSGSVVDDIGARAAVQLDSPLTGASTSEFGEHARRVWPTATINGSVQQRESFTLVDQFTITDADSAAWSVDAKAFVLAGESHGGVVQVESITSSDGVEHVGGLTGEFTTDRVTFSQDSGQVTFFKAGVYRIRLSVMDTDNVEATYTIPLVVDFVVDASE